MANRSGRGCTHTHTPPNTHACTHVHPNAHMHAHMCIHATHTCARPAHTCTCACLHAPVHIHTHAHTYTHTLTRTHAHTYTQCTHACTHAHTCTTHKATRVWQPFSADLSIVKSLKCSRSGRIKLAFSVFVGWELRGRGWGCRGTHFPWRKPEPKGQGWARDLSARTALSVQGQRDTGRGAPL